MPFTAKTQRVKKFRNEAELKRYCFEYAENRGVVSRNFTSPGVRGVPDSLFIFPGGEVVFVEFKHPNGDGVLSAAQREQIAEFRDNNSAVYTCDGILGFSLIIADHIKHSSYAC